MKPKISVITITYNSKVTLEETIKSVVGQDYENKEYIIIDGASTDGTLDIIAKYREHIAVVVSEKDNGISDAFNKGIAHATGDVIGIINSDDLLLPGALSTVAKHYAQDIDVYSGNVQIWNYDTGEYYMRIPDMQFHGFGQEFKSAHPSRFIARKAYEKYGVYSVDLHYKMDVDLLVRFLKKGAKFVHIDEALTKFRVGGASSDNISKKKYDYYAVVMNNGGTRKDYYRLWWKAYIRYYIKRISLMLFGEKLRYKVHNKNVSRTAVEKI